MMDSSQQQQQQQQQQQVCDGRTSPSTSTSSSTRDMQHDAVLQSTAIMGENVLDSPNSSNSNEPRGVSLTNLVGPPPLSNSTASDAYSVGMLASGLAWAKRQRERKQRQYLAHQAEQQLRKLQQNNKNSATSSKNNPTVAGRSIYDNPTFRNLLNRASGGSFHKKKDPAPQDERSTDEDDDMYNISTRVSKSGDGYSVQVDLVDSVPTDGVLTTANKNHNSTTTNEDWIPPVRIEPEPDTTDCPFLLPPDICQQIAVSVLPTGIAYCRWKRLYSLARDGDSFDTCLRKLASEKNTLLVIRTSKNEVFGGFADAVWETRNHQGGYYGGSNACLYKVVAVADQEASVASSEQQQRVIAYHWTGANRYVQLCENFAHKRLCLGGGGDDGHFGLCLNQDFQTGSTGPCETFDNEPLCSQESFVIVDLEIYGFLLGRF